MGRGKDEGRGGGRRNTKSRESVGGGDRGRSGKLVVMSMFIRFDLERRNDISILASVRNVRDVCIVSPSVP